jgi:hypothetical protein
VFGHPARSLEFHHVRFFEKPQHRGSRSPVSDTSQKRQTIGGAQGDSKIAASVDDIGK